jgi:hypothetical protein
MQRKPYCLWDFCPIERSFFRYRGSRRDAPDTTHECADITKSGNKKRGTKYLHQTYTRLFAFDVDVLGDKLRLAKTRWIMCPSTLCGQTRGFFSVLLNSGDTRSRPEGLCPAKSLGDLAGKIGDRHPLSAADQAVVSAVFDSG